MATNPSFPPAHTEEVLTESLAQQHVSGSFSSHLHRTDVVPPDHAGPETERFSCFVHVFFGLQIGSEGRSGRSGSSPFLNHLISFQIIRLHSNPSLFDRTPTHCSHQHILQKSMPPPRIQPTLSLTTSPSLTLPQRQDDGGANKVPHSYFRATTY